MCLGLDPRGILTLIFTTAAMIFNISSLLSAQKNRHDSSPFVALIQKLCLRGGVTCVRQVQR